MKQILDFLSDLSRHNDREWFTLNKERYQACHTLWMDFTTQYIERLREIDPSCTGLQAKDCVWRIYRDVRFSHDKRPYKEVEANYDELEDIMSAPAYSRYFGDFDTEYMLKKVPAGFDPDFVHADWLKRKAYTISTPLTDEQVCSPDFLDLVCDMTAAAKPMNDFLNYTFEEYGEFPSRC